MLARAPAQPASLPRARTFDPEAARSVDLTFPTRFSTGSGPRVACPAVRMARAPRSLAIQMPNNREESAISVADLSQPA
jgi:hypothetical protein